MSKKEIIKKSYEHALINIIADNGGNASTSEEIWDNLKFLGKQIDRLGSDPIVILDLGIKKMLAFIADPEGVMNYETTIGKDEIGEYCVANAIFTWSDGGDGKGYAKRYLSQIFPTETMGPAERRSVWEKTCIGMAMSEAYTNAGIGLQFRCDRFDLSFEQLEADEAVNLQDRKDKSGDFSSSSSSVDKNEAFPSVPSNQQLKEERIKKSYTKKEAETNITEEASITTEPNPVQADNTYTDTPTDTAAEIFGNMTIDEAKEVKATCGGYAGYSLGVIYEKKPTNLVWLANTSQSTKEEKEAARVLARTIPELASKLV